MTRRRWIADEVAGDRAALVGAHAEHLARVLRARVGQEFDIVTPQGVQTGRVTSVGSARVEFDLGAEVPQKTLPPVTLLIAVFKFDRLEWAIEKCTELGVSGFVPVIARRTESHLASAAAKRVERWRRIAAQASEQSRRPRPPDMAEPAKLKDAIEQRHGTRIVLSEVEEGTLLKEALSSPPAGDGITLAIGPEGGWTPEELDLFREGGWISASLGGTILRAETAAVAALAVAMAVAG